MDNSRISYLIKQYLSDTASPAELRELESLLADPEADGIVKELLHASYFQLPETPPGNTSDSETKERIFQYIVSKPQHTRVRPIYKWLPYAVAVAILLAVGWWAVSYQQSDISTDIADIAPGGNRAILTLADGRTITLDEAQEGIIINDEDITYTDGSTLTMSPLEGGRGVNTPTEMLSLTTPKGGTYQVTLPDGSKVWLNANSTLKYPSRFSGEERVVFLEGEAYFDIEPMPLRTSGAIQGSQKGKELSAFAPLRENKIPFLVKTSTQTVQVLGTQFNISAYPDDPEIKTTLVDGSVRLWAGATGASVSLVPGEQGKLANGTITKAPVDTEQYTSWKNGDFYFDGATLESIMAQVGRWYNVEVRYEGQIKNRQFGGSISRYKPLSDVLSVLQQTGGVTFQIKGREVIVMP